MISTWRGAVRGTDAHPRGLARAALPGTPRSAPEGRREPSAPCRRASEPAIPVRPAVPVKPRLLRTDRGKLCSDRPPKTIVSSAARHSMTRPGPRHLHWTGKPVPGSERSHPRPKDAHQGTHRTAREEGCRLPRKASQDGFSSPPLSAPGLEPENLTSVSKLSPQTSGMEADRGFTLKTKTQLQESNTWE